MKKDEIIQNLIELNTKTNTVLERVADAVEDMNEKSELHTRALDANSKAVQEIARSISENTQAINKIIFFVVFALVLAIIVLAGAEKVLKFINVGI
ncbi:MAG: hypothetical protein KatS3mg101_1062 [Patescibacteria group bacterium]|nr:MAG: hypothetical protein KatS3mg101_1062 [Patescibacteria group bacterium]